VIKSFKDKDPENIFNGKYSKKFPLEIQQRARRKIDSLDWANNKNDLRIPPSNHFEKLSGDRQGQYSIRVNDKYRICFEWKENYAQNIELTDYH
jgi:proteic killer suppression protein